MHLSLNSRKGQFRDNQPQEALRPRFLSAKTRTAAALSSRGNSRVVSLVASRNASNYVVLKAKQP